ncbi:hypothetical protein ILYODFUR_034409 [Ilyodon furcidens]|uniref:Uncharacterized protein n=1 Tax=Ilyodon furcidens TaxID=33524 RepID=A0ABV0UXJ1_9TELE
MFNIPDPLQSCPITLTFPRHVFCFLTYWYRLYRVISHKLYCRLACLALQLLNVQSPFSDREDFVLLYLTANDKMCWIISAVKDGGGGVMVWACFDGKDVETNREKPNATYQ